RESCGIRVAATLRVAGSDRADAVRVAACGRGWYSASMVDLCGSGRVPDPALDPPAHGHLARETLDLAGEFAVGAEPSCRPCHRIRHAHDAVGRREGRLEHVRAR